MTKPKITMISGPMNATHVGGVNITGSPRSDLAKYFNTSVLEPDEHPSHTFAASGKFELPRRAGTIAGTVGKPAAALGRSLSKLRRTSSSHFQSDHRDSDKSQQQVQADSRSEVRHDMQPLRMRSSMSRLRRRVGLDQELHDEDNIIKASHQEPGPLPQPPEEKYLAMSIQKSVARLTTASSIYSTATDIECTQNSTNSQSTTLRRKPVTPNNQTSVHEYRPLRHTPAVPPKPVRKEAPKPLKRADSGTAINFSDVPVSERPLGFKQIMAVPNLSDRMVLYEKTRTYWANADHGLLDWTELALGPKVALNGGHR